MLSTEKDRRLLALALLPRMKHVSLRGVEHAGLEHVAHPRPDVGTAHLGPALKGGKLPVEHSLLVSRAARPPAPVTIPGLQRRVLQRRSVIVPEAAERKRCLSLPFLQGPLLRCGPSPMRLKDQGGVPRADNTEGRRVDVFACPGDQPARGRPLYPVHEQISCAPGLVSALDGDVGEIDPETLGASVPLRLLHVDSDHRVLLKLRSRIKVAEWNRVEPHPAHGTGR